MNSARSRPSKTQKRQNRRKGQRSERSGFRGPSPITSLRVGLPLPRTMDAVLCYSEVFVLSASASVIGNNNYYQTSLYDPRGSTGGHQPLYFDQLAAIYGRYRVDKVDYNITLSVNTGNGGIVYARPQPTSTYETSVETLNERFDAAYTNINLYEPKTITGSFLPHKVLGVTKQKYLDDPNYSAAISANPAIMAYLFFYFYTFTEATQYNVSLSLKFHSHFYELQTVSSS